MWGVQDIVWSDAVANQTLSQAEAAEKGRSLESITQSASELEALAVEAGWDATWDTLYSSG